MKNSKESKSATKKPSYGEPFADPKYLRALIEKSSAISDKEFYSIIKEGIYVFRLPLIVFQGYMSMFGEKKIKEDPTKAYKAIGAECQRLIQHLNDLTQFVKTYEQKKLPSRKTGN